MFRGVPLDSKFENVAMRVIELSGGKEQLNREMQGKLDVLNDKWNQDIHAIGRILRSHLFVEHYLTECLSALNPNLGDVQEARLSFTQKLALVAPYSTETKELSVGIKRLNQVRNRMAHTLKGEVTAQDKDTMLSVLSFRYLRDALAKPGTPSDNALDVLEDFAKHVGSRLESLADPKSLSHRFSQALKECE
jgi:hypothetical protein